jgi:glycosyltransferase involved in cell wall biosynthesis
MKILQVVPYFPPAFAFGGPVKVVYQVSRELVKRKNEVVVYTSDAEDFSSRLRRDEYVDVDVDGVKVNYLRNLSLVIMKNFKLFITPQLVSRAKEEVKKFDVIHLHEYRTFQNVIVAHYAKKNGVPYVLQAHGSLPRIVAKRGLKLIFDILFGYRLLRGASKVIALSEIEAEQYRGMGVPKEKIAVLSNGLDLSEYADLPLKGQFKKKFGIGEKEKMVLYLGRIHKIKGIDILVNAFAMVLEELDDVRLVIVGPDDGYLGELKSLIGNLKIRRNVLLVGPLYGNDKLEAYVDADTYVLPSTYETFPMSALEAVACGTPVVITKNCEIAEYFDNIVGIAVRSEPRPLCEALLKILLGKCEIDRFRKNSGAIIGKFEISASVSELGEIYQEVTQP